MTSDSILSKILKVIDPVSQRPEEPRLHDLVRGEIYSICKPAGYRIHCSAGLVWVTQDNDPCDILLEAGEGYCICKNTRVLVQALEAASVAVMRQVSVSQDGRISGRSTAWRSGEEIEVHNLDS